MLVLITLPSAVHLGEIVKLVMETADVIVNATSNHGKTAVEMSFAIQV